MNSPNGGGYVASDDVDRACLGRERLRVPHRRGAQRRSRLLRRRWRSTGPLDRQRCDRLGLGGAVDDAEMANLFGAGAHPTTGEILSAPYRRYRTVEERIAAKVGSLGPNPTGEQIGAVRAEQYRIGDRAPVAGYDCTFSPVKSVSAVWALAPAAERREIEDAHETAIDAAFGWLEQRAMHTRAGRDGVRDLDAEGFIVAPLSSSHITQR